MTSSVMLQLLFSLYIGHCAVLFYYAFFKRIYCFECAMFELVLGITWILLKKRHIRLLPK